MTRNPGLWFARLRHVVVVGVLMVLLFVLESIIGCDKDEEPQVYYGPPPADDTEGNDGLDLDAVVYYGPQPFDTVDVVEDVPDPSDTPQVYYGPQPVDVMEDLQVLYGPQPVDVSDVDLEIDVDLKDVMMDVPQTWYGPPPDWDTVEPVDTKPDKDLAGDVKDDQVQTYYGPPPVYGPQPGE